MKKFNTVPLSGHQVSPSLNLESLNSEQYAANLNKVALKQQQRPTDIGVLFKLVDQVSRQNPDLGFALQELSEARKPKGLKTLVKTQVTNLMNAFMTHFKFKNKSEPSAPKMAWQVEEHKRPSVKNMLKR